MCEFTGLDFEMAIHEHYDEVLDMIDKLFVYIFEGLRGKFGAHTCAHLVNWKGMYAGLMDRTSQCSSHDKHDDACNLPMWEGITVQMIVIRCIRGLRCGQQQCPPAMRARWSRRTPGRQVARVLSDRAITLQRDSWR